jgi:hypothetical protein
MNTTQIELEAAILDFKARGFDPIEVCPVEPGEEETRLLSPEATLKVIEGEVELEYPDLKKNYKLPAGNEHVVLEGIKHTVRSREDGSFYLYAQKPEDIEDWEVHNGAWKSA